MTRPKIPRRLYITDAGLARRGACSLVREQLNEVLGTRSRRVPVTFYTAYTVQVVFARLSWAIDYLLTPKQQRVYHAERYKAPLPSEQDRNTRIARSFVTAYYSPK